MPRKRLRRRQGAKRRNAKSRRRFAYRKSVRPERQKSDASRLRRSLEEWRRHKKCRRSRAVRRQPALSPS